MADASSGHRFRAAPHPRRKEKQERLARRELMSKWFDVGPQTTAAPRQPAAPIDHTDERDPLARVDCAKAHAHHGHCRRS